MTVSGQAACLHPEGQLELGKPRFPRRWGFLPAGTEHPKGAGIPRVNVDLGGLRRRNTHSHFCGILLVQTDRWSDWRRMKVDSA